MSEEVIQSLLVTIEWRGGSNLWRPRSRNRSRDGGRSSWCSMLGVKQSLDLGCELLDLVLGFCELLLELALCRHSI